MGFLSLVDEAHCPVVDYNKSVLKVYHDAVLALVLVPRDPRPLEMGEENTMLSAVCDWARMMGITRKDLPTRRFVVELERIGETGLALDSGEYSAGQLTRIGYVGFDLLNFAHRYGRSYGLSMLGSGTSGVSIVMEGAEIKLLSSSGNMVERGNNAVV